jgi:hypothetical protein
MVCSVHEGSDVVVVATNAAAGECLARIRDTNASDTTTVAPNNGGESHIQTLPQGLKCGGGGGGDMCVCGWVGGGGAWDVAEDQ